MLAGEPPAVTGADARAALAIALAATESAVTGQPVRLGGAP
jgi:myo-inositol 2-dehydrogenase/D-chiro-inositol 1-dehydrogenase